MGELISTDRELNALPPSDEHVVCYCFNMPTKAEYESLGVWSAVLDPDANINRRKARRTTPLEVLSLALPRSGGASMKEAYSILGYQNPYHFSSVIGNVKDSDMWLEALRAKYEGVGKPYGRAEFDQLLGHCGAVTDGPACLFWEELIDAYPEAKVVLVEREEQGWLKSFSFLLAGTYRPWGRYFLRYTDPLWYGRIINCTVTYLGYFTGSFELEQAKKNALDRYRAHNQSIRDKVPQDRLLVYKLEQGWGPLCKFLGKDIPSVPFPHTNEAAMIGRAFKIVAQKGTNRAYVNIGIVACLVAGLIKLYRSK